MELSNKKIKRVTRLAKSGLNAAEIAAETGFPPPLVEKALGVGTDEPGMVSEADMPLSCLRWLTIVFIFIIPFIMDKTIRDYVHIPQTAVIAVGSTALMIPLCAMLPFAKGFGWRRCALYLPAALFLVWAGLSILWSHYWYDGLDVWLHWGACLCLGLVVSIIFNDSDSRKKLCVAIFAAGFLAAALGLCQYYFKVDWVRESAHPAATFANKNMASQFVVLTAPLGLYFLATAKRRAWSWLAPAAVAVMAAYIFQARSRACWLAGAVEATALVVGLVIFHRRVFKNLLSPKTVWPLAAAAIILLILLNFNDKGFRFMVSPDGVIHRVVKRTVTGIESTERNKKSEDSIAYRLAVWRAAAYLFRDHPVAGVGLGNFKIEHAPYLAKYGGNQFFTRAKQSLRAHNDWLQLASELGAVGILLAAWLFATFFVMAWRRINRNHEPWLTAALAIAIVGILVNAFFSFPFFYSVVPFVSAIYLGLMAGIKINNEQRELKRPPAWLGFSAAGLFFAVLCSTVWFQYRRWTADWHIMCCENLMARRNWRQAAVYADESMRLAPWMTRYLFSSGRAKIEWGNQLPEPDRTKLIKAGIADIEGELACYPHLIDAMWNAAVGHNMLKQYDQSGKVYERILAIKNDDHEAWWMLGMCRMQRADFKGAVDAYAKAVEIKPGQAKYHANLGFALYNAEERERALEHLEISVALDPAIYKAHTLIGSIHSGFGRLREAKAAHQKAIAIAPNIAEHHYNLAMAQLRLGEIEDAKAALRRALSINPKAASARKALERLERRPSRSVIPDAVRESGTPADGGKGLTP